jgi:hypothetical protein
MKDVSFYNPVHGALNPVHGRLGHRQEAGSYLSFQTMGEPKKFRNNLRAM